MHRRGWAIGIVALSFGTLGVAACGDDEPDPVTQEAYDEKAADLCERHGGEVITELEPFLDSPRSGADKASFVVADFVPRVRAIVRSLDGYGYPTDKALEYNAAADDAVEALDEIETEAIALIDRRTAGLLLDEENPFVDLQVAMNTLDIPCAEGG